MVRALNRMMVRDLSSARMLLLAVMSIILVGVMCYVTMQSAYRNLEGAKRRYYTQCQMADFWISVRRAPRNEVERLATTPGVAALQSRISMLATADIPNFAPPVTVQVVSLPRDRNADVNRVILRDGVWFSSDVAGEAIVSEAFALAHHLEIGSRLRILLNNRIRTLRIVGFAMGSEFVYVLGPGAVMPDPKRFGICYVPERFAEEASGYQEAANEVIGRFAPGSRAQEQETLRRLELALEPYGRQGTTELPDQASNQFLTAELDGLGAFATVIPSIFLLVAALVLNVLVGRLVRQQRTIIGTLKATGYGNVRLCLHYFVFGALIGVVGGLLGSIAGQWAGAGMTSVYRHYFELPDLRAGFYPELHLKALTASLVCAAVGSLQGITHVLRLAPAAAMRPEPPQIGRRILLERIGWLWSRFSAPWRLAVRGIARKRYRSAAGVFASAMGAGLLVTGFMMLESQDYLLDFEFYRVVRSDIDLSFDDVVSKDALSEVQSLPGVVLAEPQLNLSCRLRSGPYERRVGVMGIDHRAKLTAPHEGSHPIRIPHDGIVIGTRLAEQLHVEVGDRIQCDPIRTRPPEQRTPTRPPQTVRVSRVVDGFLGMSVYADIRFLSHLTDESWVMNGAQLKLDGNPDNLRRLYKRLKAMPAVRSVVSRRDMIQGLTETILANQFVFIGVLVLFSGAIFFGSIVNASLVSLAERRREVATMRALGYGPWRVGAMFFRESFVINTVGVALGLPIGYFLVVLTARLYENDLIRLPVVTAPWIGVATAVTGLFFTLAAQGVVQWVVHHSDWADDLKTKE